MVLDSYIYRFVPDLFYFGFDEIVSSFYLCWRGGGLLQNKHYPIFCVIERCGNDCRTLTGFIHVLKTSLYYFTSGSKKFNHELLHVWLYLFHPWHAIYIFLRLWFVYSVCDLFIFPLLVEPCWINLCYFDDCYSKGLHTKLWIIWCSVWVKCGVIPVYILLPPIVVVFVR